MIVLAALDDHVVILYGNHARLALVGASACTGPIGLRSGGLVPREGELADLQLAAAAEARDVGVIRHGI